uniref:Uncharacterized protein n=1 Tax=Brassica campestris TaxID=3711 RepID=M4FAR9_BRACM
MLPDHLKGEDKGLIAITEETSDPAESGIRGQQHGQSRNLLQDPDPISKKLPESLRRPDPRPPPYIDKITRRFNSYQSAVLQINKWGANTSIKTPSEESSQQAPDGDRGPPNPFAPVDECDYMLHGSTEKLNRQETVAPERQQHRDPQGLGQESPQTRSLDSKRCRTLQRMKVPSNEDIHLESKSNPTGHAAIRGKTWPNHRGITQADISYGLRTMISI